MASAPPLPEGFEEVPVAVASPAPVTPVAANTNTTPSGMDAELYRSTLDHLVNTGASRDQILAFAQSAGFRPEQLRGLDGSLAYRDDPANKGKRPHIVINPISAEVPVIQHDTAGQTQPALDALPEGFEEVPLAEVGAPQADAPTSMGGEMMLGVRHALNGVAAIPDLLAGIGSALPGGGAHTPGLMSRSVNGLLDAAGVPNDANASDRLVGKMIEGATSGALTGGEMGAAPMLANALGGAGSGGATEYAAQQGAGPGMQLAAGLAGGLAGAAPVAATGALANAFARERTATPLMQAFDRQNVPALPADVGGTGTRMASAAANTTLGGIPIHEAAQNSILAARTARDRIAAGIGNVAGDATAGGNVVQSGAKSFLNSTEKTANGLYEAIPIGHDHLAVTGNTKRALQEVTTGLTSNPELSRLWTEHPRLKASLEALTAKETVQSRSADYQRAAAELTQAQSQAALMPTPQASARLTQARQAFQNEVYRSQTPVKDGSLSWGDMKRLRTIVGKIVGSPSLSSEGPERQAMQDLYGALSEDMKATARAEGPKAEAAFARANSYWRARQARIENVVTPILGKDLNKTPEAAFRQIESWAADKGSFIRTAQALRTMPQEEADSARATIFAKLGNVSAGQQNAAADVFSPSTFLTQWNKMPERTKSVLFPGKEYQKDISDLLAIAEAQKGATQFANTSKTATTMHLAAAGAGFFANPIVGLTSIAGQFGTGKLLASPGFARWLASSAKKPNPAAQLAHVNRLTRVAAANPIIANDVLALQERLAHAFTQQPLAAQEAGSGQ